MDETRNICVVDNIKAAASWSEATQYRVYYNHYSYTHHYYKRLIL